jgi:hypothetical protein
MRIWFNTSDLTHWSGIVTHLASDLCWVRQKYPCTVRSIIGLQHCQVVEQCDLFGGLFVIGDGLIGKGGVAGGHLVDVTGFSEGCSPVHFPVVPRLIDGWATALFATRKFYATQLIAALVPVDTMVALEMGMPVSSA